MNSADRKYFDDNHADLVAVLERIALALEVNNGILLEQAYPQRWVTPMTKTGTPPTMLRVLASDYRDDEAFE